MEERMQSLAEQIFKDLASEPILMRVLDDGRHPEELYIDLANEAIAAALTFGDAWRSQTARERRVRTAVGASRSGRAE